MMCVGCGKEHAEDERELAFKCPDIVAAMSLQDRKNEVQENADICIVKGRRFFIRAIIQLPVLDNGGNYSIGVWVELSQLDFERIYALWDDPCQAKEAPFPVSIANAIPGMPDTHNLQAALHLLGPKRRPKVVFPVGTHPLTQEQAFGISRHRAFEYGKNLLNTKPLQ